MKALLPLTLSIIPLSTSTPIALPPNTTFTPSVDPSIKEPGVSLFVLGLIKNCFPNASDLAQHASAMTVLDCGLWDGTIAEDGEYTFSVQQPGACYDFYNPWREGITTSDVIKCMMGKERPDRNEAVALSPNITIHSARHDPPALIESRRKAYFESLWLIKSCFPNSTPFAQRLGAAGVLDCGLAPWPEYDYPDSERHPAGCFDRYAPPNITETNLKDCLVERAWPYQHAMDISPVAKSLGVGALVIVGENGGTGRLNTTLVSIAPEVMSSLIAAGVIVTATPTLQARSMSTSLSSNVHSTRQIPPPPFPTPDQSLKRGGKRWPSSAPHSHNMVEAQLKRQCAYWCGYCQTNRIDVDSRYGAHDEYCLENVPLACHGEEWWGKWFGGGEYVACEGADYERGMIDGLTESP